MLHDVEDRDGMLVLQQDNAPGTLIRLERITMEAGKSYTVVLTGTSARALETILVTDALRTYATR